MAKLSKALQAASVSDAAGLNVEEVFSTYLYNGTGATQSITNGIDLSGEGGMVWLKLRSQNLFDNSVYDTERGAAERVVPNSTAEEFPRSSGLTSFNSDGFTLGGAGDENENNEDLVSWTFRKAPKFFDVVTYTGNSFGLQVINHSLGSTPGVIIIKKTSALQNWAVWHKDLDADQLALNTSSGKGSDWYAAITLVTDTSFRVGVTPNGLNDDGETYVAYLFAHNDGDGEFGPTGDQDIIKCGRYIGDDSTSSNLINLGFEPQFVLIKCTDPVYTADWMLFDTMRGIVTSDTATDNYLRPNLSNGEGSLTRLDVNPTGFTPQTSNGAVNRSGREYIYIAIRRGPMGQPESSADVFDVDGTAGSGIVPNFNSGFPLDMIINKNRVIVSNFQNSGRIISQNFLQTDNNGGISANVNYTFDYQDGYYGANTNANYVSWMWRRYPGFFDVSFYKGDGVPGRTVTHNLGVTPEMIWVKKTNGLSGWPCYLAPLGATKYLELDNPNPENTDTATWNDTEPSDTSFTVGDASRVNQLDDTYIAYLFASLPGISKVGSYTGDGTTGKVIDCGFSNGARFVLIKRYDLNAPTAANWSVFDSYRGISSGNDPQLFFNEDDLEDTGHNLVDTTPSGFIVNYDATAFSYQETNASGRSYIFYAIAAP